MSGPELYCAGVKTIAVQGQGSYEENEGQGSYEDNEDGLDAALPTPAFLIAMAPLSDNSSAWGYEGQTALAHSNYLRREETRAMLQQLFTMKKENIRVDGVYNTCSYAKKSRWNTWLVI